ncbi:MAG: PBP1A family penicillin-binding protein [Rhodospirillales bacterium]|nr:PBP1A family penicillin-binding protein [Rhodospirillales bacterium]
MAKRLKRQSAGKQAVVVALAKWTATVAVWGFIAVVLMSGWFFLTLPDIDTALDATRRPTITLLAADGSVLAAAGDLYGLPVQLADVPDALPKAIIATEDRRFYSHFGLDVIGLLRAAWRNAWAGRIVQGGSTITQQVAKNLFLTAERTLRRKAQEAMLSLWLEYRFSKEQILTIYLNRVYLGAGTYGVDAAARKYFGRPVRDISTYQSALLAGLLKAPSRYNPHASVERSRERTRQVLANMVAAGYLTEAQAGAAEKNPGRTLQAASKRIGQHFADWVLSQVPSYISAADRDLTVITTLDARLQRQAERQVRDAVAANKTKYRVTEAAALVMRPAGAVVAMVGGTNYSASQFNRTTQALRQPGSTFKPFIFLAGFEAGLTPSSLVSDGPVNVAGWKPQNYKPTFDGDISLTDAMANSINTVAVRVAEKAGVKRVVETLKRFGITADLQPDLGLALGASEVTMIELTAAYAPFANGGYGVWPYAISEIRDGQGTTLYRRQGGGPGRVESAGNIAAINTMLGAVIERGTGKNARIDRPAAGKSGTTQSYRDAWFIGYTADLVAAVWVGNDDGTAMKNVTGGGLPARMWRDLMTAAHGDTARKQLPSGLQGVSQRAEKPVKTDAAWQVIKNIFGGDN